MVTQLHNSKINFVQITINVDTETSFAFCTIIEIADQGKLFNVLADNPSSFLVCSTFSKTAKFIRATKPLKEKILRGKRTPKTKKKKKGTMVLDARLAKFFNL